MVQIMRQLIELPQAPGGQGGPAASTRGARLVVELFGVAHEEVYEQKYQQEGRQQQIDYGHPPVPGIFRIDIFFIM